MLACSPMLARADNTIEFYSGDFFDMVTGRRITPGEPRPVAMFVYNSGALNFDMVFNGNDHRLSGNPILRPQLAAIQLRQHQLRHGTVLVGISMKSAENPSYNFTGIIESGGTLSGEIVCD